MQHTRTFLCLTLTLAACSPSVNTGPQPVDGAVPDMAVPTDRDTTADVAVDVVTVDDGATDVVDAASDVVGDVAADAPADVTSDVAADVAADAPTDAPTAACTTDLMCPAGQVCDRARRVCAQCVNTAQCGATEVCVAGRCAAGTRCTTSRTCPGQVCDMTRGACVDCTLDTDCMTGQVCRGNACVAAPRTCRSSRECNTADQVCDMTRSVCVDCVTDADCGAGLLCTPDNLCRRQACVPSMTSCVDASHLRTCNARGSASVDTACATNETCAAGRCQARVCTPGERSCASATTPQTCNPDGLGYTPGTACVAPLTCGAGMCTSCVDTDMDGLSDTIEGAPATDTDMDGTPDFRDMDSDNDGFTDRVEGERRYPRFDAMARANTCGSLADNCDAMGDRTPNFRDTDSDDDGLSDADERGGMTNPCAADTDGDGFTDLVENAAGSSPTDGTSRPPSTSLYVTLPYHAPGTTGAHETREFSFQTRIRAADVMFLVDTTGSMGPAITAIQSSLSSTIVPGIVSALGGAGVADVRYGVSEFRDFANGASGESPTSAYALRVLQRMDVDPTLSQRATMSLEAVGGGDLGEAHVPAMHALLSGVGLAGYNGTATRTVTAADCGGDAMSFGWGCFRNGRVPIIVNFSDAEWHNGPTASSNFYTSVPTAARYPDVVTAFTSHGALYIGIDVVSGTVSPSHYEYSVQLARATGTLDASGNPVAFRGTPATVAGNVVTAINTLIGQTRQDITLRVVADPGERRLPAGHTTAEFARGFTTVRGVPEAPTGYERRDATTFFNVLPSTAVTFSLDFYNDGIPGGAVARVFAATLQVIGRAGSVVDSRPVYILVPADAP